MSENTENITPGLGFVKDPEDSRDLLWRSVVAPQSVSVPTKFRLSALGKVLNQGQHPFCVAYSSASLKMHQEFKEHKKYYTFDPDWLYAECKKLDGIPNQDGTFLRVALQVIQDRGYLAKAERYKLKDATGFKIEKYVRVTSKQQIKEAIYHIGPVVFGITVDEGIYAPVKGVVPEPADSVIGGHAMIITGYDDNKKCLGSTGAFLIKNSWGKEYGSRGYIWLPYSHFDHYSDWDAWRSVDATDLLIGP
jgi:C1A family cysteine protease